MWTGIFSWLLEALDLGYLRVPSGVDFPFCADLFHRKPLLHLDLSGVMQWKIFDPVLEMILAELPDLESLAIQGLQLSDAVFGRFCRGCRQLRHLQMRGCSTPQAPFVAPAYTACKNLRVADFAGTMALLTSTEAAELRLFMAQLDEFALTAVLDRVEGFDRRGTEPFELFGSEFGQNSVRIKVILLEFIRNSENCKFLKFYRIFCEIPRKFHQNLREI